MSYLSNTKEDGQWFTELLAEQREKSADDTSKARFLDHLLDADNHDEEAA